jgi:RNA-binding protein Nova
MFDIFNLYVLFRFILFFSGTTERVCLITGSVDAIMAVMDFIMEKIREKPDLTTKTTVDFDSGKATAERDKQVIKTS